jgi:general secretion pathway protein K
MRRPMMDRVPRPGRRRSPDGECGFALLAVMLVMALLGVVLAEFAYSMRLEASMVRAYKESLIASHLAEAGVHQAIREILSEARISGLDEDGQVVFYRLPPGQTSLTRLPSLRRIQVPLGPGEFSYRISDEEARLNVNLSAADRVERLLTALGVPREARDVISDSLQDWKDANDEHRPNGAESEDYYLKLPTPYRARNAYLQDAAELLQVRGVTPELYWGKPDRPGLEQFVTVFGRNVVNLNTAAPAVLSALGLSDAEIIDIVQTRVRSPYPSVPGRFGGRGLDVASQTFRIEAEGVVAGEPKARVVAIVQRRAPRAGLSLPDAPPPLPVAVLAWRVDGER